jgi:hypothetical protein
MIVALALNIGGQDETDGFDRIALFDNHIIGSG